MSSSTFKLLFSQRMVLLAATASLWISGCGPANTHTPPDTPVVVQQKIERATPGVKVTLTLDKSQILNQEFMYNLDLQYSSQLDPGMNLYNQSAIVDNIPVIFRVMGDELQLIADNKLRFPSDNNHPEDLIGRFLILSETSTTLTVTGLNSAPFLASQFADTDGKISYLKHWVRSFDFDANGNYLLQETSLTLGDGKTTAEFMESIYPRKNLATGALFQKFEMDPTDPVGAKDGPVARFRFLPGNSIITHDVNSEKRFAYAQHYDISPKADGTPGTIDWYVTPNIPDQFLPPVKQSVEGWNRYFEKMKGIERPVVRFMGRLPLGIKIGDPRYNVINWDSRRIAGAAYETQAADPVSGRQSHSLIYMPAAWLQIGADYWKKGVASDPLVPTTDLPETSPATGPRLRATANLRCGARDLGEGARLMLSGKLLNEELKTFGIQLLKQTLFHEVGHALGFAHNFQGSLSYDLADPKSMFSTSIMDYNDFELERAAFYEVNSSDGPLLEYDRQLMSALYNGGKDIADSDKVLPTCNDAEADNEDEGVNPLCVRYDLQKDPTQSINVAIERIENEKVDARNVSLAQALNRIPNLILSFSKIKAAHSKEDVLLLADQFGLTLKGSLDFYIVSDVAALTRTVRTNLKSLLEYSDPLPEGYDEKGMRERVYAGVLKVLSLTDIPATPKAALAEAQAEGLKRLAAAPFIKKLDEKERNETLESLKKAVSDQVNSFTTGATSELATARAKVLASLVNHRKASYFVGKLGNSQVDFEKNIVGLLADAVTSKNRTPAERLAAATSLKSFASRGEGNNALNAIKKTLLEERVIASTNKDRRTIEGVLAALGLNL